MQIAVCDDEKVYLDCLSKKIEVCFKEFEIEISLDKYLNAVSFLEQHNQNPYDVVFLDILMPEMNGLDVANRIRNLSEKTIIMVGFLDTLFIVSHFISELSSPYVTWMPLSSKQTLVSLVTALARLTALP